ncbi:hypothetical protein JL722_2908 [Aureococcus anophagefferens]|nr:hypothetical protein JL722_2908 [Aureococcus anophagefferens]
MAGFYAPGQFAAVARCVFPRLELPAETVAPPALRKLRSAVLLEARGGGEKATAGEAFAAAHATANTYDKARQRDLLLGDAVVGRVLVSLAARAPRSGPRGAAAAKIWARTSAALPGGPAPSPRRWRRAELPDDLRQACGLSRAKAKAVVGVARAFLAGDLSDELLATAPWASSVAALRAQRRRPLELRHVPHLPPEEGGRPPLGDLGVRAGAARAFGVRGRGKNGALDMKKDADVLEALFAPYAPYRSLAAYYMWRVVDTKAFNQDADA